VLPPTWRFLVPTTRLVCIYVTSCQFQPLFRVSHGMPPSGGNVARRWTLLLTSAVVSLMLRPTSLPFVTNHAIVRHGHQRKRIYRLGQFNGRFERASPLRQEVLLRLEPWHPSP
jgi:hypothetical protein